MPRQVYRYNSRKPKTFRQNWTADDFDDTAPTTTSPPQQTVHGVYSFVSNFIFGLLLSTLIHFIISRKLNSDVCIGPECHIPNHFENFFNSYAVRVLELNDFVEKSNFLDVIPFAMYEPLSLPNHWISVNGKTIVFKDVRIHYLSNVNLEVLSIDMETGYIYSLYTFVELWIEGTIVTGCPEAKGAKRKNFAGKLLNGELEMMRNKFNNTFMIGINSSLDTWTQSGMKPFEFDVHDYLQRIRNMELSSESELGFHSILLTRLVDEMSVPLTFPPVSLAVTSDVLGGFGCSMADWSIQINNIAYDNLTEQLRHKEITCFNVFWDGDLFNTDYLLKLHRLEFVSDLSLNMYGKPRYAIRLYMAFMEAEVHIRFRKMRVKDTVSTTYETHVKFEAMDFSPEFVEKFLNDISFILDKAKLCVKDMVENAVQSNIRNYMTEKRRSNPVYRRYR